MSFLCLLLDPHLTTRISVISATSVFRTPSAANIQAWATRTCPPSPTRPYCLTWPSCPTWPSVRPIQHPPHPEPSLCHSSSHTPQDSSRAPQHLSKLGGVERLRRRPLRWARKRGWCGGCWSWDERGVGLGSRGGEGGVRLLKVGGEGGAEVAGAGVRRMLV